MKKSDFTSVALIILSLIAVPLGHASEAQPNRPLLTSTQVWLGPAAGFIFGFGSGQSIQNRWSQAGWPFTVADGVAAIALLSTFGDCLNCSRETDNTRDTVRAVGAGIFIASRIVQVGELIIYGIKNQSRAEKQNQKKIAWTLMPDPEQRGGALVTSIRF